jgi:ferredoxin
MSYTRLLPVRFEPSGKTVMVSPGTTLLDAALRAGFSLGGSCNGQGACGECRLRVLMGEITALTRDEEQSLAADDLEAGVRLGCCARACSPLTVRLVG